MHSYFCVCDLDLRDFSKSAISKLGLIKEETYLVDNDLVTFFSGRNSNYEVVVLSYIKNEQMLYSNKNLEGIISDYPNITISK